MGHVVSDQKERWIWKYLCSLIGHGPAPLVLVMIDWSWSCLDRLLLSVFLARGSSPIFLSRKNSGQWVVKQMPFTYRVCLMLNNIFLCFTEGPLRINGFSMLFCPPPPVFWFGFLFSHSPGGALQSKTNSARPDDETTSSLSQIPSWSHWPPF